MEVFLNLAWVSVAMVLACLWLRWGDRDGASRRRQIVALAILIAILLPVISVSDDLMAMQNATETDSVQRRDHLVAGGAHIVLPFVAVLSVAIFGGLPFGFQRFVSPGTLPHPALQSPERTAIQNRPPPAA